VGGDDVMTESGVPEFPETLRSLDWPAPLPRPVGVASLGLPFERREPTVGTLVEFKTQRNPAGGSQFQIQRGLAQARRLMLASKIEEALGAIERIEPQLDDVPPAAAQRYRAAAQLLRAAGLAFQDNSLGALSIALSHLKGNGAGWDQHTAATLCRLGCWQLGEFDAFNSLPRHQPRPQGSRSWAISAVLDLSIEAAAAHGQLRIFTAKRLAFDASAIAEAAPGGLGGLSALPACLTAQMLYAEGLLDQAERILRDRLPLINAAGSVECALRAYLVLARIARHRMQHDFAALLLREAETLGERRGWPRLVAACLAERACLLLREGRLKEARLCFEHLDRHAETHRAGSGHSGAEIARYRTLTRWRVSWAEAPSVEAVAAMRQVYRHAIEKRGLYFACRLAVELAEMLAVIGETEEADTLMLHTIQVGAAAGLYQIFLEGGEGSGRLLRRAHARCGAFRSADSEVLPFLGSLLSQWDACRVERQSAQPANRGGDTLTIRECEVLGLIGEGFPNKRIALLLAISPETVKSHVKRIFQKLAAGTRAEAVSRAKSLRLL
ncbi:MAG: LuxR C-terminal-related transcriptional regulator, partial [Inquilinus sp.]|uniref:helix-turn-helix transcriptional regulator n=1 Tax=Inquilinus sp. TaxID=1932117 RepID=UPI003F309E75